jgi:hypothetical protein
MRFQNQGLYLFAKAAPCIVNGVIKFLLAFSVAKVFVWVAPEDWVTAAAAVTMLSK